MELDPNQPFNVCIEVCVQNRRHPPQRIHWKIHGDLAISGTSNALMSLAMYLRNVLCGKTSVHRVEMLARKFCARYGVDCPCSLVRDLARHIFRVSMVVTQPHLFCASDKRHALIARHPIITIWDTSELAADTPRCGLCHGKISSVMYAAPCGHTFHIQCISRWGSQHPVCPVCNSLMHFSL